MLMTKRRLIAAVAALAIPLFARAQLASSPPADLQPTHANLAYASQRPEDGNGHLLDLYLPPTQSSAAAVVIWTGGSAWLADSGKSRAGTLAAQLGSAGFAVA